VFEREDLLKMIKENGDVVHKCEWFWQLNYCKLDHEKLNN
jgi:hypothetical protein